MRRVLRLAALPLLAVLVFGEAASASAAAAAPAPASAAATCAGTIQIDSVTFSPASVTPGQSATVTMTATNCTAQPVTASVMWYGRFSSAATTSIPPGCPAVDPLQQQVTFAAGGSYTSTSSVSVFSGCTATSYQAIYSFSDSTGTVLARGTGTLNIVQTVPALACHVTYTRSSEWQGGFVATIAIANTGTVPVNGWTLTFTFGGDQHLGVVWNATGTQSGETVSLTNASSDPAIAPGATLSGIGFTGTWHASDAPPASFTLNGVACT